MTVSPAPRKAFRRYVRLDCEIVRERDFRSIGKLALDLSTTGMLVETNEDVLTGEEVVFAFRPPHSDRFIDGVATVARVIHGRRPGDRGRAVGLEFHGMNKDDMAILWESLRGLPPPEPTRHLRSLVG
jgi:PilZ domain